MNNKKYNYVGIGFWIGAGLLSLINLLLNLKQANVLSYNYLMIGVSIFGLILNIILIKRKR
jgi:hypothetical protein